MVIKMAIPLTGKSYALFLITKLCLCVVPNNVLKLSQCPKEKGWSGHLKIREIVIAMTSALQIIFAATTTAKIFGPMQNLMLIVVFQVAFVYQARALRALGLLLADNAPTVGRGETF